MSRTTGYHNLCSPAVLKFWRIRKTAVCRHIIKEIYQASLPLLKRLLKYSGGRKYSRNRRGLSGLDEFCRYVVRARSEKGFPSQGHYLKFTNGRWRLFLLENNLLQGTLMWWKTIFLSWRNIWYSLQEMWIAGRTWFISYLEMMSREMPHFLRSIYIPVEIEGVINELFWEQPKVELLDFDKSLLWSKIKILESGFVQNRSKLITTIPISVYSIERVP